MMHSHRWSATLQKWVTGRERRSACCCVWWASVAVRLTKSLSKHSALLKSLALGLFSVPKRTAPFWNRIHTKVVLCHVFFNSDCFWCWIHRFTDQIMRAKPLRMELSFKKQKTKLCADTSLNCSLCVLLLTIICASSFGYSDITHFFLVCLSMYYL